MKKFFFLIAFALFIYNSSFATIRRVGFFGSPLPGVDYSSFSLAYTAAVAGDTILMFPNTTVNATIAKKLTLIGPGSLLDPTATPKGNANLQAFAGEAALGGSMIFAAGSDGSVAMGFHTGNVYIAANNITIARNRDITITIGYTNPAATTTNLQVLQNYNVTITYYTTNASSITNMNISNNLISSFTTASGNTYSGNISNNVWAYDATQTVAINGGTTTFSNSTPIELGGGAYLLQNNIFESYYNTSLASNNNFFYFNNGGNSVFNYNLALQTGSGTAQTWGVGIGNVITPIANASSIFAAFPVLGSTSADARYQLGASSPALTVGAGGTPIGMFAGTTPYKLSDIPTIPTIYSLSSPQGNNPPGSTIQINVSTRGNN